jgi:hypothetical protein
MDKESHGYAVLVFSFLFRAQQCQETVIYIFMAKCPAAATAATWYLICCYS